jgi:hypothetical protein
MGLQQNVWHAYTVAQGGFLPQHDEDPDWPPMWNQGQPSRRAIDGASELAGPGLHCHSSGRLRGPNQRQKLEINEYYQHVDNPKAEARFI